MADYVISSADLSDIRRDLRTIGSGLSTVNDSIGVVSDNVGILRSEVKLVSEGISTLTEEFRDYRAKQDKENARSKAQQKLITIRQELDKRFGHYDKVRRNATGILQADDLGVVKKNTITNVTEEMMLSVPGYWLAPCLLALAAWIDDKPELAARALREGIKRNDEKTSLFFSLICRRADRKDASLKWVQRYLANQDEENLDRKTITILDAFASGLLGSDTEGVISKQMNEWLEHLGDKPGFVEQQTKQWSDAINAKRPTYIASYEYLTKYSKTWPLMQSVMEGAMLHSKILEYLSFIFEQEASTDTLKAQLDEILDDLVTEYDDEEVPLKKEERLNELIVEHEGDENRANQIMAVEQTAFELHKDFTQLLTDAAMSPDITHANVSTQKFAIALSVEWISNAYSDIIAQNRMMIPNEIMLNIDTFNDKTTDGRNEAELTQKFSKLVDSELNTELQQVKLNGFEKFCLWGGAAIGLIGLILMITGKIFFGLIALIGGAGLVINHFSKKKKVDSNRSRIVEKFEKKRKTGTQIIRACLAEIVDYRAEFAQKDAESQKVLDFLEQISPDQYVRKLTDSNRRIKVQ